MKIVNLNQHGQQWLQWRKDGIGSSDAPALMGATPWGRKKNPTENEAMARGHRLEPEARKLYEDMTGRRMPPVCIQHDKESWLRASLDGWNERDGVILEIKCPINVWNHLKVLRTHRIPDYYIPQVMHQLLVCDTAQSVHFWSYTDAIEVPAHKRYFLVAVHRDSPGIKEYLQELYEKEKLEMDDRARAKRVKTGK